MDFNYLIQVNRVFCLSLCFLSCSVFAEASSDFDPTKNFELSLGMGVSSFMWNNGTIQATATETDKLSSANDYISMLEKAGVGYHLFSDALSKRKYLNDLLLELNLYHSHAAIHGAVWQYQQSNLDNYTFNAPIDSTRLMLDVKPNLFTQANFSPYPIVGVGMSWNKLSYSKSPAYSGVSDYTNLDSEFNRRIAYDLGFGVHYHVTQHVNTSLEYLYNRLGHLSSSNNLISGQASSSPASILTHSQNILFNVSWQF